MHRPQTTLVLAGAILLARFAVLSTAAQSQPSDAKNIAPEQLDGVFSGVIGSEAPGCIVAVRQRGVDAIIKRYGLASLEYNVPITENTIFDCGSISKQFTGFLVALLIKEGKVSLEDDVRKYIPEMHPFPTPITIRHLVYHMSGLRDYGDLFSSSGITENDPVTTKDALALLFKQRELNFTPGSQYMYTNAEYLLLKEIVSRVSGKPMKDVAQERIFEPLGMRNTRFQEHHSRVVRNRAWGYKPDGGGGWFDSVPVADIYGPSNLFTTIGDLLLWQENFVDQKVGGPAVLQLMKTAGQLTNGKSTNYGLGLNLTKINGRDTVGHAGDNEGFRSVITWFPSDDFTIVILANRTDIDPSKLAAKIAALRFGPAPSASPAQSTPTATDAGSAEELKRYAGIYLNPITNETRKVESRDGGLIYARGGGLPMTPLGAGRFALATTGGEVEFHRSGRKLQMLVKPAGQEVVSYDQQEPFTPSSKELQEYGGVYHSDELDVRYVLSTAKDGLAVRLPRSEPFVLRPSYRDAFSDPDFSIRFSRRANGKVDGFRVNNGRVRNLAFVREQAAKSR